MVGAVSHFKSLTMADFTGTVTVFNSAGQFQTQAATDLVRPSNWNSAHEGFVTLSGNTSNLSTASGLTNLVLAGGNNITLSMATAASAATVTISQQDPILSRYTDWGVPGAISSSAIAASASIRVFGLDAPISFTRADFPIVLSISSTANASTFGWAITSCFVIYTNNASTLSPVVGAIGTTTYTYASNTSNFSQINSGRLASFPISTLLTPGEYFIGIEVITATTTSSGTISFSVLFRSDYTAAPLIDFGSNSTQSGTTNAYFNGVFSGTISATNQTIAQSNVSVTGANQARGNFPIIFRAL